MMYSLHLHLHLQHRKIGESLKDPSAMYLGDIYTVAVNLCGLPGITVPCGKDSKGLPIGIQMIGDCFMEKKILRAAHAYETSRGSLPCQEKEAPDNETVRNSHRT